MPRLLVSLICVVALAPVARAQLVVHVTANGASVYGAEVAAWSDSGRLAMGHTDGAGIARLPVSVERTPIAFITARRMGFSPGRLSFPSADSVTVWLQQKTTELATVAVTARPLRCPARSEDEAVTLWSRAAARYTPGQDTMPWSFLGTIANESVSAKERGFGEAPTVWSLGYEYAKPNPSTGHGRSSHWDGPYSFIYGTYHPPFGEPFDRWTYPTMMGAQAGVFASGRFGEQHTFVILGRAADIVTLGFCARTRPDIDGELEIGPDTTMLGARWTFRLPHHQEDAGGESTFGVAHLDGAQYLVAVATATWRRIRPDLYDQTRYILEAWKFGHTHEQAWLNTWQASGDKSGTP